MIGLAAVEDVKARARKMTLRFRVRCMAVVLCGGDDGVWSGGGVCGVRLWA